LRFAVYRARTASMIVSGGASPRDLFRALKLTPVPWYLVDIVAERRGLGAVDDDDSSEGLFRRELLSGEPGFATFVSLYRRDCAAVDSLPALCARSPPCAGRSTPSCSAWGPTATWRRCFPIPRHRRGVAQRRGIRRAARAAAKHARVSLTPRSLLDAHEVSLVFFGGPSAGSTSSRSLRGRSRSVRCARWCARERVPVNVYWAP